MSGQLKAEDFCVCRNTLKERCRCPPETLAYLTTEAHSAPPFGATLMSGLDEKGLEAAWLAHDNACPGEHWKKRERVEAAIRAYLSTAGDAGGVKGEADPEPQFDWNNTDGVARQRYVDAHSAWAERQVHRLLHPAYPSPQPDPSGLEALVERLREIHCPPRHREVVNEAADAIAALIAERDEARRETEDLWKARHTWFNATVNALRSARVNLDRAETAERALTADRASCQARVEELERALDSAPEGSGMWRYWNDKANALAARNLELAAHLLAARALADRKEGDA